MSDLKLLGEFYFSQLLKRPIVNAKGVRVGRVIEMVIRWDSNTPHVTGIIHNKRLHKLIPIEMVAGWDSDCLQLTLECDDHALRQPADDETFVGKWLLDKQLIDLKGSKLVRVNDLKLAWVSVENQQLLVLTAVDIGVRGLLRRLGFGAWLDSNGDSLVGWQFIKPLESRTSHLQLTEDKQQLKQLHPADIADILETMGYRQRASFLTSLDSKQAVDALAEMELEAQVDVISQMDTGLASDILEEMPPDDAADILSELPSDKSQELLSLMESDDADDVRELMKYAEGTAGSLMTTEYIGLSTWLTAEQAINKLRELAPTAETIYYLFVVDDQESLMGVLSLRELIIAAPDTPLSQLMRTNIIKVNPYDDLERVADLVNKYGLLALPVIDANNSLLGIITVDDILEILIPERGRLDIHSRLILHKRHA